MRPARTGAASAAASSSGSGGPAAAGAVAVGVGGALGPDAATLGRRTALAGLVRETKVLLGTIALVLLVLASWGALLETSAELLARTPLLLLSSLPAGRPEALAGAA